MKKLDRLILKSYIGPLVLTFSISMFVLVLQFLWRKMETIIGKGLDFWVIGKMFVYACASLVPMALPLSILLASIMTMGGFGEKSELTAMKASGISLWRILKPLIILNSIFAVLAFYFASFVIPGADMQLKQIAADIRDKKPAINIKPQEFYTEISSYVIRIEKKDKRTGKMYDVLIYDHSKDLGNTEVIKADSGLMYMGEGNNTLIFKLYSGDLFMEDVQGSNYFSRPLTRVHFKEQTLRFDVSDFSFKESDSNKYTNNYKVINIVKLYSQIDSLEIANTQNDSIFFSSLNDRINLVSVSPQISKDSINGYKTIKKDLFFTNFYSDYAKLNLEQKKNIEYLALMQLNSSRDDFVNYSDMRQMGKVYLTKHWIEFYRKFTLSLACIILFFIGASLGSIIRKGGLGVSVIISIVAFLLYIVIGTIGESAAKAGSLSPLMAMWFSSIIFFPIGIILTMKATSDSKIFSSENWVRIFNKIIVPLRSLMKSKSLKNNN